MENRPERPSWATALLSSLRWAVLLAVAVLAGRFMVVEGSSLNLVSPATGVAALWALLHRSRSSRWLDAGLLVGTIAAVNIATGAPWWVSFLLAGVNLAQAVLFAVLVHRWTPAVAGVAGPVLVDLRGLGAMLLATLGATTVGAWAGSAVIYVDAGFWTLPGTVVWQTRNAVAIVLIVPLGLRLRQLLLTRRGAPTGDQVLPFLRMSRWRWAELVLAVVATELGNIAVFVLFPSFPIAFPLFALTAWVALRFDTSLTALRNAVVAVAAVIATLGGDGPFALIEDIGARALVVQVYAGMGAVLGLALSLGRDERLVLLRRLRLTVGAATEQARQVQVLADASRNVLLADNPRTAVCEAVREASGADGVYLLESDGLGHLVSTAVVGEDMPPVRYSADPRTSLTAQVFATGTAVFVPDFGADPRASRAAVEKMGIASGAWIPAVVADDRVIAIVGLCWREPVTELPASTSKVLDVLTQEAARAIERGDLLEQLARAATQDQLTGLANRRRWDELSRFEVARAQRSKLPLSLLLVDLDHFKAYNDSRGHIAGDVLLRDFAAAATAVLRDGDTMARWGGEEFAVALPDCTEEEARVVAERILGIVPHGQTATVGIARWTRGEGPADTLDRADTALYHGKRNGRAQVVLAGQPVGVPV